MVVDCECFTSIGNFDTAASEFCSDSIGVSSLSNSNLDGNDVVNYIMYRTFKLAEYYKM